MGQAEAMIKAKYPYGHPDFIPLCFEEMQLHSDKNYDYAHGDDPLGNFKRVSKILKFSGINLLPYTVAWVYMMKQVDAVGRMIGTGYTGQVEGVKSRLMDISVYAKLIWLLYAENTSGNR